MKEKTTEMVDYPLRGNTDFNTDFNTMKQSTKFNLLAILFAFIGIITLGGLGNIAAQQHFYWFPLVVNLGVYGFIVYHLFKRGKEE